MLTQIHPKLPMRNKAATKDFYCNLLGFEIFGSEFFEGYLMLQKDKIQIHFFEHQNLIPEENYGQVYIRTNEIENVYAQFIRDGVQIHPNGKLELKHWEIKEFSILDPDSNLLTFGENGLWKTQNNL
jgi:catechol 2,3-dioxygenase-like lactoylglutathione lyase family enzyme